MPFFFKQWGNYVPAGNEALAGYDDDKGLRYHKHEDGTLMLRVGTGKAGAVLEGREWREMPALLTEGAGVPPILGGSAPGAPRPAVAATVEGAD